MPFVLSLFWVENERLAIGLVSLYICIYPLNAIKYNNMKICFQTL